MSNDGYVQVPADSTGKKVDASSLTVGADIVIRQRIVIADPSAPNSQTIVTSSGALTVIHQGTAVVAGSVFLAGPVSLSGVISVAITSPVTIGGGNQNIGAVSIGPGTSNIGYLDSISKTVQVQMVSRIGIDNISATTQTLMAGVKDTSSGLQVPVGDSANSAMRVNIVAGAASGVSQVDDTSFSSRAAAFVPVGGVFSDSGTGLSLSASHGGAVRMTGFRAFHANLRTDGGVTMEDSANSAVRVNIVAGAAAGVSQVDDTTFSTRAAPFVPVGGVFSDAGTGLSLSASHGGAFRMTGFRAQHVNLRDNAGVEITSTNPLSVKVEMQSATSTVILAAGSSNIGTLNGISQTVNVAIASGTNNIGAVSLGAGQANIGFINNISATVNVVGIVNVSNTHAVVLAVGTANFGTLNDISRTVQVAVGTPFTINNISATVTTAWATPQSVNNISATVTVTTANPWVVATQSQSHGPVTTNVSISTTAAILTAPGVGQFLYVTMIAATHAGTINTTLKCGPSVSTGEVQMFMQSAGGGGSTGSFVLYFDPPWKLPGNEALMAFCKPNAVGKIRVVANFFVRNT